MADWKWSMEPTFEGMRSAIDAMEIGLLVEDAAGSILYANERILDWTRYAIAELEHQPISILIPEELRDKVV
jgi:PAS domain S-box-containing protein